MMHQSKRSLPYWILATFLLCLACSSRRIARELGVHIRTGYRWCWWLRNAALSYEMQRQLEGTVEADDLYHTAGQKGQAKQGGKKALGRRARGRRRSVNLAGAIMTKTDPRLSPGSVARGLSSSRRPEILPSRQYRRPQSWRSKRAVSSIRTRPAAIGRSRAMSMNTSIIPRRSMSVATCTRIGPSVCFPC